jgi:hypothetical protein
MEPRERRKLLGQVMEIGSLLPAVERVSRAEMEAECFGDEREVSLHQRFRTNAQSIAALRQIARDWTRQLPEGGSVHTMFNCIDILAGDLGSLFLSVDRWYTVPNGFVFDAEELIRKGATFRNRDILGELGFAIENIAKKKFGSVPEARAEIEQTIDDVVLGYSFGGSDALAQLRNCHKKKDCTEAELIWHGRLPISMALEVWSEGHPLE